MAAPGASTWRECSDTINLRHNLTPFSSALVQLDERGVSTIVAEQGLHKIVGDEFKPATTGDPQRFWSIGRVVDHVEQRLTTAARLFIGSTYSVDRIGIHLTRELNPLIAAGEILGGTVVRDQDHMQDDHKYLIAEIDPAVCHQRHHRPAQPGCVRGPSMATTKYRSFWDITLDTGGGTDVADDTILTPDTTNFAPPDVVREVVSIGSGKYANERILGRLNDMVCSVTITSNFHQLSLIGHDYEFDVEEQLISNDPMVTGDMVTYSVVGRLQSRVAGPMAHDNYAARHGAHADRAGLH